MDPSLRSNGSNTHQVQATKPPGGRSRVAPRVQRLLDGALAGERGVVLNVSAAEMLSEPGPVADAIGTALGRPGVGVTDHWTVHKLFRGAGLDAGLLDALTSNDPPTRAAAARICGAARLPESALWIADLLDDPEPEVRQAAVMSLARLGGRRAVDELMAASDAIPLHRLAIALAGAATDIDVEVLLRQPVTERAAVATVLACGLRRDVLRVSALLGIAHDRRWPVQVRLGACRALAMISDRSASDGLHRLADIDPDADVRKGAARAHIRLLRRAVAAKR